MTPWLLLTMLAAPPAVEVTVARGVSAPEVHTIQTLAAKTSSCAATVSGDRITLRVVGGPTRIRVVARRMRGVLAVGKASADLERGAPWRPPMERLTHALFPDSDCSAPPAVAPPEAIVAPVIAEPTSIDPWPWVMLGSGVALAGAGVGFGLESRSARAAAEAGPLPDAEYNRLRDRTKSTGLAANILFSTAAAAAVVAVAWWIVD
ncbi:MAG: hypothetical protein RIT81_45085 [Deltaproteobacteria bacterium]